MFTISGIHVIHIHVLKKVMAIKPPSLWAFQVVQISQLSTMTNWISFCYTPSQQASRDCIAWQLYLWTRNRCQQPRTSASTRNDVIPSVDASKVWLQFKIYLLDRGSVRGINCPVNMVKMAAGHYLLVRTILHGAGLLIMIARPNLLCRTSMITPCQLGIQKLHLHWKYPSGSGIYSHTVRHFPAASPSTAKRSTVESTLFTLTSSPGHVNHVTTIMTLASFAEFWNLYCPRTIRFS